MMKITTITVLFLALLLGGCATTPTKEAAAIQVWEAKWLSDCQQLKTVDGSSFWDNFIAKDLGEFNAEMEARQRAADAGATHLVWQSVSKGIFGSSASGTAYRCTAN